MVITWLFGNGLDLSFGLKTRYCDFYEYLEQKDDELQNNIIYKQLKKDIINEKLNLWSDYELRLGEITEYLDDEEIAKFRDDKIDIDIQLCNYLVEAEKSLIIEKNNQILLNSFKQIEECKRDVDKEIVTKLFNTNEYYQFQTISFNYTKTVSYLCENHKDEIKSFRINGYPKSPYECTLKSPLYVHGTLSDGEMIIGVNDTSQINSEKLKNYTEATEVLTKIDLEKSVGQNNRSKFQKIINSSSLICMYGLSIGDTDKYYWEIIKQKLFNSNAVLIIYYYKTGFTNMHPGKTNAIRKEVKNLFFKNSNANKSEKEKIENRIIVEINHELFKEDFNLNKEN